MKTDDAMHLAKYVCDSTFARIDPVSGDPLGLSQQSFGVMGFGWLELTALALLTSLLALAAMYLFATFTRNQQVIAWLKFELYQILATAVVVLFTIFAIVGGMCSFDMSIMSPTRYAPHTNMYDIADGYLDSVQEMGELLFVYLMYVVKIITFISKIMWTSNPLGVGSSDSPLESLGQLNNLIFFMVSGYVLSFLLLLLQQRMLEYLSFAVLYFIYPFGVFFRAFEPTRNFGGTMIGISISFFLFFPILLVMNDYVVFESSTARLQSAVPAELDSEVGVADAAAADTGLDADNLNDPKDLKDPDQQASLASGMSGTILFLFKPIMLFFIAAVVLPVINFTMLVEITRGITHTFGEEIDVTNLTRLI